MIGARFARVLFIASALGEVAVGLAGLAWPALLGVLLDIELDRGGLVVARMLAAAALAIGATWWFERRQADALPRNAAGFLIYNFAIGALFVAQGLAAVRPALPTVLGLVHVGAAIAFLVLVPRR